MLIWMIRPSRLIFSLIMILNLDIILWKYEFFIDDTKFKKEGKASGSMSQASTQGLQRGAKMD